ncbi:MAG: SDR family NAD(P)-dependent oxidoreductase, partial [Dehalococcoidia bacterium]|nr:SDR family NAD(P)-dependent oxidoreductase [Dehalococcoidia bacterium]
MQLQNKVAIVTGAGSGIGRAAALLFANEGARVVAADIIGERAEETRSLGGESSTGITPSQTDVSRSADVERMVDKTLEDYGKIDILVSNAGMMIKKPAEEMTEEEWDRLMGVNLKAVWLCPKYVIPPMKEAG